MMLILHEEKEKKIVQLQNFTPAAAEAGRATR